MSGNFLQKNLYLFTAENKKLKIKINSLNISDFLNFDKMPISF